MGALNIPSAADIERLTRRVRSVSQRLEGIEDGVGRLDRVMSPSALERSDIGERLTAIEAQLGALSDRLDRLQTPVGADAQPGKPAAKAKRAKPKKS